MVHKFQCFPFNSNTFSDWRIGVSRAVGQNSLTSLGNNNLNFRLVRDQLVLHETAANLCASRRQAPEGCSLEFLVGVCRPQLKQTQTIFSNFVPITLNECPRGTQSPWLKHWGSWGKKTLCFPCGQSFIAYKQSWLYRKILPQTLPWQFVILHVKLLINTEISRLNEGVICHPWYKGENIK